MKVLQLSSYQTVLVALFCCSLFLIVCVLVLGCRQRWLLRRRCRRREQKLRQQSKNQSCRDVDASSCHLTVGDQRPKTPDESSKVEMVAVRRASPNSCAVTSRHNVCHCLPRGLRRKSPATAVIRRGRSIESFPLGRRPSDILQAVAVPHLTHSASLAVLSRPVRAGSRPELIHQSPTSDADTTSVTERWTPITVAGETTFPVRPSAAIFLSVDADDSIRFS